jgi:two-component system response regulator ResD
MKKILLVEDEPLIVRVLTAYLRNVPFEIDVAVDGEDALLQFSSGKPDLVLLDVMLPKLDGWAVLAKIREISSCPVIMLTARSDLQDRLHGLNGGADDYMPKPFVPDEVVARIRAVLRRPVQVLQDNQLLYYGNLKIDLSSRQVSLSGAEISLIPRDLALLIFLAEHPNQLFTREQLIDHVWGMDYDGSDRAVDLAIKRLRKALSHCSPDEGEIKTLRGTGYQFSVQK